MKNTAPNAILAIRIALLIGAIFLVSSCGESLSTQPTPVIAAGTSTTMPNPTTTPPTDDIGGPRPIPTSDNVPGGIPTSGVITGPIVGTSVAGGPVEGPPLTSLASPTPHPPLVPGPDGVVVLRSADRPTAALMSVGNTLKLELEDFYDWTIGVSDPTILTPESDGSYRAARAGTATLEMQGDPKCLKFDTPCGAPSIGLTVSVTVK